MSIMISVSIMNAIRALKERLMPGSISVPNELLPELEERKHLIRDVFDQSFTWFEKQGRHVVMIDVAPSNQIALTCATREMLNELPYGKLHKLVDEYDPNYQIIVMGIRSQIFMRMNLAELG